MKLMLGGTPVKKMMIHNDTMDATMVASDMQAGVTAYANGQKVIGTGKSFEFATYGDLDTNINRFVPNNINIIEITSYDYPVKSTLQLKYMKDVDFSIGQNVATIIIDGIEYNLIVSVNYNMLKISCDKNVTLQVFFGKDNYV